MKMTSVEKQYLKKLLQSKVATLNPREKQVGAGLALVNLLLRFSA